MVIARWRWGLWALCHLLGAVSSEERRFDQGPPQVNDWVAYAGDKECLPNGTEGVVQGANFDGSLAVRFHSLKSSWSKEHEYSLQRGVQASSLRLVAKSKDDLALKMQDNQDNHGGSLGKTAEGIGVYDTVQLIEASESDPHCIRKNSKARVMSLKGDDIKIKFPPKIFGLKSVTAGSRASRRLWRMVPLSEVRKIDLAAEAAAEVSARRRARRGGRRAAAEAPSTEEAPPPPPPTPPPFHDTPASRKSCSPGGELWEASACDTASPPKCVTCGDRIIRTRRRTALKAMADAKNKIAQDFPEKCGGCAISPASEKKKKRKEAGDPPPRKKRGTS